MKTVKEIIKRLLIYDHLRKECKKINYKPSQYWYQAKIEALLWVLGVKYNRILFIEWVPDEEDLKEVLKKLDIEGENKDA